MTISGVLICGFSVGMFNFSALGLDPFQVFVHGIFYILPDGAPGFGTVYAVLNLLMLIAIFLADRKKIGLGTLINIFLLGYVAEYSSLLFEKLIPEPSGPVRFGFLLMGIIIMCFSSALYFTADMGVSTYDAISLIISEKRKWKFQICRISSDMFCTLVGFFFGATVGIGTVVTAFFMGPLIAFFNRTVAEPLRYGKTEGKKSNFFVSFIPRHVSNRCFLMVYRMLAWIKVPRKIREKNYIANCEQLRSMNWDFWDKPFVCIENQNEWKNIRFGAGTHHNMGYSGCEIIATYNAWKTLKGAGTSEQMAKFIAEYEAYGAALWGEFGTSPKAMEAFFKRNGFSVMAAYGGDRAAVDRISNQYKVMIATVYNDRNDITKQVHTVCITADTGKGYILHNTYIVNKNGVYVESAPYAGFEDAVGHISRYEPKLIYLIGIGC